MEINEIIGELETQRDGIEAAISALTTESKRKYRRHGGWTKAKREALSKSMRKAWKAKKTHRSGYWQTQIARAMAGKSMTRIELTKALQRRLGKVDTIYPAIHSAMKNGLLMPGEGGILTVNKEKLKASAA